MKIISDLYSAPSNISLTIEELQAGPQAQKKLLTLGLHPGDLIQKKNSFQHGPVLLETIQPFPTQIAIGKRLARKIIVSYEQV